MTASAKNNPAFLICSLLLLAALSACASKGGFEDAPVATADELGIPEGTAPVDGEVATAEPKELSKPMAVAEPETKASIAEYPTLFQSPYLVKGLGEFQLKSLWSQKISGDGGLLLHFQAGLDGEQACAAGRGAVHCFNKNTGERLWKRKVRDLASGVSFSSKAVLVGTDEGEVVALSRDNGEELWRATVGGEVLALSVAGQAQVGEVVVSYTTAGNLVALRARDGETIWVQEQKVPRLTLRGLASPLIVDGLVVAGHDNGRITAFNMIDGKGLWADELVSPTGRNELERLADIDGAIAHYRGDVFAASWGGKLGAWSARKGRALWRVDIASVTGVAADLRRVYVADTESALHALDSRSGRILWKREDLVPESEKDDRRVVATTVLQGAPLVLDNLGRLYYYKRATGDLDFSKTITGEYATAPAVDEDLVLSLSRSGLLNLWQLVEAE